MLKCRGGWWYRLGDYLGYGPVTLYELSARRGNVTCWFVKTESDEDVDVYICVDGNYSLHGTVKAVFADEDPIICQEQWKELTEADKWT